MGLFNKKEGLPSLPPVPTLPDLPKSASNSKINELPTIPSNSCGERLNQEIVKSVVSGSSEEKKGVGGSAENFHHNENSFVPSLNVNQENKPHEMPKLPSMPGVYPEEKSNPPLQAPSKNLSGMHGSIVSSPTVTAQVNNLTNNTSISPGFSMQNRAEPIFVRIDKFQSAKKEFEEVRSKIKDIEHMLRRIKEVKIREDAEIQEWVKDLEGLKTRLSNIDAHIFNKL